MCPEKPKSLVLPIPVDLVGAWVEERLPYCCVVPSLVTSREGECQKMATNAKTWQWQQCMFIGCCCVRGKQCSQLSTVIIQLDSGKLTEEQVNLLFKSCTGRKESEGI